VLALYSHGTVHGTFTPGSRDFDDSQAAPFPSKALADNWDDFAAGQLTVNLDFRNNELAWIESTLLDKVTFIIGCVTLGGAGASIILCATMLQDATGVHLPGELGLAGLVVSEGAFFLCGATVMVPVFIAGMAVSAALFQRRGLHDDERAAAVSVFADTIPYDNISITNLELPDGRAFTVETIDGTLVVCVGKTRYDSMVADPDRRATLIHELTHVWQIGHHTTIETICSGLKNKVVELIQGKDKLYYGDDPLLAQTWDSLNTEEQAVVISECDTLRQLAAAQKIPLEQLVSEHYIRNNILGVV
jgi:hypothetical protein